MYLFFLLNKLAEFLPPLFTHLRHDGVEQPELLAPLIHLVIRVLEHHLETVVHQEIVYGLERKTDKRETTELKHLTKISLYSISVEMRQRNIAHIALFPLLPGWKLTFLHEFHGQLLVDLGQLLLEKTRENDRVKALMITDYENTENALEKTGIFTQY